VKEADSLKNVKRVCPKRKIKGQEKELVNEKIKEMNPKQRP